MAMSASEIEQRLRASFPDAQIAVSGDDGVHMAAEVICESFRDLSRVRQHQLVYKALQGAMDGPDGTLHALALTTRVPD